jgi:phthiocerol/phenolphthiocerol synthesis type-I polyketide synthase E
MSEAIVSTAVAVPDGSAAPVTPVTVLPIDPRVVPAPAAVQRFVTLPNGLEVACQSAKETDHIYDDIFAHRVYLSHGITLWDGACVFDVGGNIGLFTVFLHQTYRDLVTYTFEPAPPLFQILHHNAARYGTGRCKLFPCGISNRFGTASLTFYPYSSGMSSFYGNDREERDVLRVILENQQKAGDGEAAVVLERSEDFLDARLTAVTFDCPLVPLSHIIRQEGVTAIDLLKIDVQKSELDVLRGLAPEDWSKVRQIAMEVHDLDGQLVEVQELLHGHGYNVVTEQDPLYHGSVMYNLYAVQKGLYQRLSGRAAEPLSAGVAGAGQHERSGRSKAAFARLREQRKGR